MYFVDGENSDVLMAIIGLVLLRTLSWIFGVSNLPNSILWGFYFIIEGFSLYYDFRGLTWLWGWLGLI